MDPFHVTQLLIEIILGIIASLIGAIMWFVKERFRRYEEWHASTDEQLMQLTVKVEHLMGLIDRPRRRP